jgi:hypothetical protein
MDTTNPPRPGAADAAPSPALPILSSHPAFCQLGLPLRAIKGPWNRDVGTAAVTMTAADAEHMLPGGKLLRVLLLHIFDTAIRSGAAVVELGPDAATVAQRFGLETTPGKLRELTEALERLATAKVTVSTEGGAPLSLFDGRARAHIDAAGWRASVKLNTKFLASLLEKPVALDAAVVKALANNPVTLDVYMAVAFAASGLEPQQSAATTWDDLMLRFGSSGQEMDAFRPQFEDALRTISGLCPLFSLVVADRGVDVRKLPPRPAVIRAPRPPAEPKPERVRPERPEPRPAPPVTVMTEPVPLPPPAPVPTPAPTPVPTPMPTPPPQPEPIQRALRGPANSVALRSHLTGLQQVVWLQRANGRDDPLVEITPGSRYDPVQVTVLALEPVVVQITGGLYQRDFERVSAWTMTNRDLIDAYWYGEIDDTDEIMAKVKKVPAPGWRD